MEKFLSAFDKPHFRSPISRYESCGVGGPGAAFLLSKVFCFSTVLRSCVLHLLESPAAEAPLRGGGVIMGASGKSGEIATPASLAGKEHGAQGKPVCFVISQIGAENSPERDRADKVLRHVIEKPLSSQYKVERADEIGKPGLITVQVIQRLASAELVVADLTGGNPNVYYELALRHYFAKPVVHIIERGQKAPFDVSPMRYVEFDLGDPDVLDAAREELVRQVEAMEKGEKVVTLVQVARVFSEPSEGQGNETREMLTAIYGALGNLQESVGSVAAQVVNRLLPLSGFSGLTSGSGSLRDMLGKNFQDWLAAGSPIAAGPEGASLEERKARAWLIHRLIREDMNRDTGADKPNKGGDEKK